MVVAGLGGRLLFVALLVGWWVARSPHVQAGIAPPAQIRQLVGQEFRGYYSQYAATSFAAKVWTNNVWVAAQSLMFGILLGIPTLIVLIGERSSMSAWTVG